MKDEEVECGERRSPPNLRANIAIERSGFGPDEAFGRVRDTVTAVVLLSQMIRTAAITGRTDTISAWFGGRQGGRWAEQTVRAAIPTAGQPARETPAAGRDSAPATDPAPTTDPAETLQELTELHERGVVTDAEFETLRADLRV